MTPAARRLLLVVLSFVAFVSLGLPDAVLGVAWPFMRQTFDLPISRLGAFLACGVAGYLASSLAAGTLVRRLGVGRVLLFSTCWSRPPWSGTRRRRGGNCCCRRPSASGSGRGRSTRGSTRSPPRRSPPGS
jgi:hypothetical protein